MSALNLVEPIAAYFTADKQGADAVAHCFTMQGVIKDKGQTHTGREEIKAWKAESLTLYTCTTQPYSVGLVDGIHAVCARVTGNFPGSPINLNFLFRLERGLIARLEITV